MANRVPLSSVVVAPFMRDLIIQDNNTVSVLASSGAAATVYASSTGTSTLTSTAVGYDRGTGMLRGYVVPGEYSLSARGYVWYFEAGAGDGVVGLALDYAWEDPTLACMNFPFQAINSMAATSTDETAKFVRIRPKAHITAAKIVSASGTAIATITGSFVGLYTTDGTTLTRVAVNATNTSSGLWDTNNTMYRQALSPATTVLQPGQDYFVGMLVDATTAGAHAGFVKTTNMPDVAATEVLPPMYTLASQTSLPTSQAISGLTAAYNLVPWVAVTA